MGFRRSRGIVTDDAKSNPALDADYIVAAMIAGLALKRIAASKPVQFDMSRAEPNEKQADWERDWQRFRDGLAGLDERLAAHLSRSGKRLVNAGLSEDHKRGAVVIGVYTIADQPPPSSAEIREPEKTLSPKGRALYEKIKDGDADKDFQYIGLGAYTGFVDNPNREGDTDPVGPLPTARFLAPNPATPIEAGEAGADWLPRWLPSDDSTAWAPRVRRGTAGDRVPWGLIGGELAAEPPRAKDPHADAPNRADQLTLGMADCDGMVFHSDPTIDDIAGYTHGMIQALYKAYHLGPSCRPFEITVGKTTMKLASCFACTVFMTANEYPPSSTHLGRGDSWVPLYEPYKSTGGDEHSRELAVIRDMNGSFARYCDEALRSGAEALAGDAIAERYRASRDGVLAALDRPDPQGRKVGVTLFLDALTVHGKVIDRLRRVLGLDG